MGTAATASFENIAWDQTTYDQAPAGPALHRASIRRRFTGELSGDSTAELLMCAADDNNAGYTAVDRFNGSLGEHSGSFVFQHSGIVDQGAVRSFGSVVPGSGTGALRGLRGEVRMALTPEGGHLITLDYELA